MDLMPENEGLLQPKNEEIPLHKPANQTNPLTK